MPTMSFPTLMYLTIRAVHVLLAATWVGSMAFMVFFVMPALKETGAAAGPMMGAIARRGLNAFMGAIGGLAVVTGFYLYWRLTGGFDPALSASHEAMVFGTGGIAGLISVIISGAVVGRSMKRMGELGGKALALPEGSERTRLMTESNTARDRAVAGARIVLVLQMIALVCMAIGHYV
jgi:uncharacterized membrane protein